METEKSFAELLDEFMPSEEVLREKTEQGGERRFRARDVERRIPDFKKFFRRVMGESKEYQQDALAWLSKHQPTRTYVLIRVGVGILDTTDYSFGCLCTLATHPKIDYEHKKALARFLVGALNSPDARERAVKILEKLPIPTVVRYLVPIYDKDYRADVVRQILGKMPQGDVVWKLISLLRNEGLRSSVEWILDGYDRRFVLKKLIRGLTKCPHLRPAITDYLERNAAKFAFYLVSALANEYTREMAEAIFMRMEQGVAEKALRRSAAMGGLLGEKADLMLIKLTMQRPYLIRLEVPKESTTTRKISMN